MDISGNAPSSMDIAGVKQASPVLKPEPVKPETVLKKPEKTEEEQKSSEISRQDMEEMVEALKEMTQTLQTKMNFSIDEGTNDIVIKVLEKDTDKIIKQFPPEELLELQEKMQDLTGLLFNTDA